MRIITTLTESAITCKLNLVFNAVIYSYNHLSEVIHVKMDGGQQSPVYSSNNSTYYLRGAFGETLSVYGYDGQSGIEHKHWNIVRPDGTVIGRRESGGTRRYYHRDHLGSTRAVVTSGGTVTEVYDYMPFGDMMDGRITTSSGGANEKFTGHEFDDKVNLYYMQWRRYIPRFGVFTSVDPLTDVFPSWSPYNYAMNNPLIFIDPDGRSPVCGAYQNCDNTYEIGSIVSNRLGSWQYMGNDQWETLSLAENVTEITSTVGHAWHWFTNTLDEFYNFGDRTIAENKFNVISISVMDNPGAWLVGGLAVGSLARGTGAMATKGVGNLAIRSDIVLSGGRSGQLVKTLTGPANSVVKGGQGRIFITDKAGKVVWDITKDRAKSVIPGQGFGPKVAPTQEQLNLLKQVWGN